MDRDETIEAVLDAHAGALGRDYHGYRNHVYRVVAFATRLAPEGDHGRIAVAAAFHDLGIWTAGTFDYLAPSVALAVAHLTRADHADQAGEVSAMIIEHHKIGRYRGGAGPLVEPFRQADWIDVTRGLVSFGLPRAFLRETFGAWPNAGFHRTLVALTLKRARHHPFDPIPVLKR